MCSAQGKPKYVYASVNISSTVSGKVLPVHGWHTSLGLNIPGIFNKDFVFGPVLDFRLAKRLGVNKGYRKIRDDVNRYIITDYDNPQDSSIAGLLLKAFNPSHISSFTGNYFDNYGLMFSPFPHKYGGIMLQVKKGKNDFPIDGAFEHPFLNTGTLNYIYLRIPTEYCVQLTFKPLGFSKERLSESDYFEFLWEDNFFVSLFYKKVSLSDASIYGRPLNNFFHEDFLEKYSSEHQFGIKISVGIY